jgi:hypothetical protein
MIVKRSRRKQTVSFDERLRRVAQEAREAARRLPQGHQRDMLLKKADQAETAVRINGWLAAPRSRRENGDRSSQSGSLDRRSSQP